MLLAPVRMPTIWGVDDTTKDDTTEVKASGRKPLKKTSDQVDLGVLAYNNDKKHLFQKHNEQERAGQAINA